MNVRGVSEGIYLPCIWLNPTTQKAEVGTYSYTALMEKFQKQVEQVQGKPPELGNQTLSEAEIQALAEKYDPQNMSQAEYDEFIRYKKKKGVLSRLETSDLGMSRITIVPGYFEPAYISGPHLPVWDPVSVPCVMWVETHFSLRRSCPSGQCLTAVCKSGKAPIPKCWRS